MTDAPCLLTTTLKRLDEAGLTADDGLLIGFSGGLDSSVLVDLVDRARRRGGPSIELIHVDHGLRPDSQNDAQFCTHLARRRGLPIHVERLNLGETSVGQAESRRRRMAAIAEHALGLGIEYVALAHHGDDRIETFLFHLRRGTGLDGLAAMPAESSFPIPGVALRILRPLIGFTRAELEAYAERRSIDHVVDPTNATDAYSRNRLRHHLVPHLAEDSRRKRAVIGAIERLHEERRAADHYATELAQNARLPVAGIRAHAFRRDALAEAPRATVARLFLRLEPGLDASSIARIHDAIAASANAPVRHLTLSRCVVTVSDQRVLFEPSEERGGRDVLKRHAQPISLRPFEAGSAPFFGALLRWELLRSDSTTDDVPPGDWSAAFDAGSLRAPLEVAGFRAGARLRRTKKNGQVYHQKLTELLRSHDVDAHLRWRWPCLYDDDGNLLWVAGIQRATTALRRPDQGPQWRLSITPSKEMIEIFHS